MATQEEENSTTGKGPAAVWKHIGLHSHSVGTLTADGSGIKWKSAMMDGSDIDVGRFVPSRVITAMLWTVFGRSGHVRVLIKPEGLGRGDKTRELRFDGFPHTDYDRLRDTFKRLFDLDLERHTVSSAGYSFGNTDIKNGHMLFRRCILEDADEEGEEFEPRDGDEMMSVNLAEVSQCVLPGNNRNEIELQFHESDTVEAGTDQLVAVRFYIPPDPDTDPSDREAPTSAEMFQQRIMKMANIKNTTGDVIVEFDEAKGTFLTPRGRYSIELYDSFLRMRGNKYDYKIKYDDISRLFLLPKPDEVHMAFVIALDKPIRQGQQRYQNLVMQTNKDQSEVTVNLDEATLQKEYGGDLQPVMYGSLSNLVAKTFKVVAKKKVFIPGKFANANQQACVKCALRASEGHLYPLEKQFIFIHKPTVLVRFEEVESVEFQRYAGGQGSTRNFDLCVTLRSATPSSTGGSSDAAKEYIFSGIDRSDYAGLYNFLSGKKITIKNIQDGGVDDIVGDRQPLIQDVVEDDEMEESSEDGDYGTDDGNSGGEGADGGSDDEDDDDLGSVVDSSDDSDLDEARKKAGNAVPKKGEKKRPPEDDGEGEDEEEEPKKKKKKKKKTEKPEKAEKDSPKTTKKKQKKDPNAPKKALSSFMFFINAKRPEVKEKHPDATFGEMSKLLGAEYKKLSEQDLEKWKAMAQKDKERYEEEMKAYKASKGPDEKEEETKKKKKKKSKKSDVSLKSESS